MVTTNYAYDEHNRLERLGHSNGSGDVAFYDFAYDAANRITQITDVDGVTDYRYNARNELTGADHEDIDNPDEVYGYDANGNRVESHLHGTSYGTGTNNQLTTDGVYSYTYDAEGNMTTQTEMATGNERLFVWDHLNRLIAVIDVDSADTVLQEVEYAYDTMGRRIAKSVDGATTHFVYDRDDVLLEFDGSTTPLIRYLHGPQVDQVLAQEDDSGTQWLLGDHLGTIKDLVDDSGNLLNHRTFDSYGNLVGESSSVDSRYAFTGREFDEETELYYYRARYYDGAIGRFISQDPIGFESETGNLYGYVENSPIGMRDPLGLRGEIFGNSWNRHIFYEDNGRLFTDNIEVVKRAKLNNPNVSIVSDVTTALIRWAGGGVPPRPSNSVNAWETPDYIPRRDVAGHIVGRQLGGYIYDTDPNNYFAQNRRVNGAGGRWYTFEGRVRNRLDTLHENLKDCGGVALSYAVSLDYSSLLETFGLSRSNTLRPDRVIGEAKFYGLAGLLEYHYENAPNPK